MAARATNDEIIWARQNTPENNNVSSRIGYGGMSPYTRDNADGISVFSGSADFYYYRPVTLRVISEVGGVCGSKAQIGTELCRAHGVPAVRCSQPSHAAYIWYQDGEWSIGNNIANWDQTWIQGWEHITWGTNLAYYFRAMEEAQRNIDGYRLSEKMRIATKLADGGERFEILEDAARECPYNIAAWRDLEDAIKEEDLSKDTVRRVLLPTLLSFREKMRNEDVDLVKEKEATASECFGDTSMHITDSKGKTALCRNENGGYFEIALDKPSTIKKVYFQWWRLSKASEYKIYAMSEQGQYELVRTQDDETKTGGYADPECYLQGWDMITTKIKVELITGRKDNWKKDVYFGIKTFEVMGISHDVPTNVLKDKTVYANEGSSGVQGLVDDDHSTAWTGGNGENWIEVVLGEICIMKDIEFLWKDGAKPEEVDVILCVGDRGKPEIVQANKSHQKVRE